MRAAARAAGWRLPRAVAAAACAEDELARVARRLPAGRPGDRARRDRLRAAARPRGPGPRRRSSSAPPASAPLALGPAGEPARAARRPGRWPTAPCGALEAGGAAGRAACCAAEDHLADLLLFEGSALAEPDRRPPPGAARALTAKARERMRETALAYVRHGGNSVAMAAELHVHPQTARYRIARLRELLGDAARRSRRPLRAGDRAARR